MNKQDKDFFLGKREKSMGAGERERFFVKLGYIISGLGWTRCFFKMTNQHPKFLWASDGSFPSQLIPFSDCTDRSLWSSTSPCTIFTSIAYILTSPASPNNSVLEWGREEY